MFELFKFKYIKTIDIDSLIYTDCSNSGNQLSLKNLEPKIDNEINIKDIQLHESPVMIFTFKDFENRPAARDENNYILDDRSNWRYYKEYLTNDCIFFSLFLKTSYADPIILRFLLNILNYSILFTLNAMLFSDEYIDKRVNIYQNERVDILNTG